MSRKRDKMPEVSKLKKFLSHFSPVTIEVTSSDYNHYLEVQLTAGKYVLNSGSSNYSYGSLHTLFKKTFRRLNPDWEKINDVLILGFGAGCVAETIRRHNPFCRITGVEIDGTVIRLARKYFHKELIGSVSIHECAAEEFIASSKAEYDLVIIDLYTGTDVPVKVQDEHFILNVRRCLREGGMAIFNKYVYSRKTSEEINILKDRYLKIFGNVSIMRVMLTGRMFISVKDSGD